MTSDDLERLEKVAQEATQGEWKARVSIYGNGAFDAHWAVETAEKQPEHPWSPRVITFMTGTLRSDLRLDDIKGAKFCRECEAWHIGFWREVGVDVRADPRAEADAKHIAAFDPPTALSLIDRIRAAEALLLKAEECLARIGRMTTMPDDKMNTFTLVTARNLAASTLAEIREVQGSALPASPTPAGGEG
jgi:hypothetical protein